MTRLSDPARTPDAGLPGRAHGNLRLAPEDPRVVSATCNKRDTLAPFLQRNEHEVVVDPSDVTQMTDEALPPGTLTRGGYLPGLVRAGSACFARFGPTTPTRAAMLADASVDPTEAISDSYRKTYGICASGYSTSTVK